MRNIKRLFTVAVGLVVAAFALSSLAGSVITRGWNENLNATKRSIVNPGDPAGLNIMGYKVVNASAAAAFIHFYTSDAVTANTCADVTQGTTTPAWVEVLPANGQATVMFPQSVYTFPELCVTSTTTYKGVTGSANGVALAIFQQ